MDSQTPMHIEVVPPAASSNNVEGKDAEKEEAGSPVRMSESPHPLSDAEETEGSESGSDDEQPEATAKQNGNGKGSEDEGGSEEDEDEDEDEDEEPALKYERIVGSIPDLFKKDSASALAVSNQIMALGTHAGIIHILDMTGKRIKSYKPHMASILDIQMDATADWVASASIDGQVIVHSLSTPESYSFDMKRPMRTIALEPNFARKNTRAFVYGGMSGNLILREKGWLGHKENIIHSGDGPIWQARWRGRLIAFAIDSGVKIYDHASQTRLSFIDRPPDSPRADLFKCTLHWQDDTTLIIGWADYIKVARIRARPRGNGDPPNLPPLIVEVTAIFQLDCMISGLVPHPIAAPGSYVGHRLAPSSDSKHPTSPPSHPDTASLSSAQPSSEPKIIPTAAPSLTAFLVLSYIPPETFTDEQTDDRTRQARKAAERPELRIISRRGEELSVDALTVNDYTSWGCNDYILASLMPEDGGFGVGNEKRRAYVVMSPRDLILVRPRDRRDHVLWLMERRRYEEALEEAEKIEEELGGLPQGEKEGEGETHFTAREIGQKLIEHLVEEGNFVKAAQLCPKVCASDAKRWEHWVFAFAERKQLQTIIPYVPTDSPRLDHVCYEMVMAHFLTHDRKALLKTIREWPRGIYDIGAVIIAVKAALDRAESRSRTIGAAASASSPEGGASDTTLLMECLAELYTSNRQFGKALPFYLRLRRPNVFDLIKENNLFTDVQDQVLLLVEFDHELMERRKKEGWVRVGGVRTEKTPVAGEPEAQSDAINLLVENYHSIPIVRVVQQLQGKPYYLFLYLDALLRKEPHLVIGFADLQVKMYAEFAQNRLIDFLRASNSYNLEQAYKVCQDRELVPEMVFLLGRMGNNKQALMLIIERLGDVNRAIDFAKEQSDDDLWEDLLMYSESRPAFIRGLLENVGVEISPIRLIRRIKNGLEIPGLKEALIKILQDFHLQISLLEGCQTILDGDSNDLSKKLQRGQGGGFFLGPNSRCKVCSKPLHESTSNPPVILLFLCRHEVHAGCAIDVGHLPSWIDPVRGLDQLSSPPSGITKRAMIGLSGRIAFETMIKSKLPNGCPVCHQRAEGMKVVNPMSTTIGRGFTSAAAALASSNFSSLRSPLSASSTAPPLSAGRSPIPRVL